MSPESMAVAVTLQKMLSCLDVPEDAVGKLAELQKSLFDSGASMNDIAAIMDLVVESAAAGSGGAIVPADLLASLLAADLSPADLERLANVVEGFASAKLAPDVNGRLMQIQTAIEAGMAAAAEKATKARRTFHVQLFFCPIQGIF